MGNFNKMSTGKTKDDRTMDDTGFIEAKKVESPKTSKSSANYGTGSVKETIVSGGTM